MTSIRRIEIKGFKTFGRKVPINFDKGLTVITGPNGSGKSNILDAVKFALGELSPKELRGGNFSDIIHKNSLNVSPKAAHVSIQFNNSDRKIPIDSDFFTISREFRRNGEGIYRINGKRASRKQLTDLLSSANIQVTGFNLIPQHAVTRLAEITPEERRRIIENMIGIAIYDTKKTEAQLQLQQADLNIKVASARIEEVERRVETLEKERNEYLKYSFLKNETNRIKACIISNKIEDLCKRISELETKKNEVGEEIRKIKERMDELSIKRKQFELERNKFEEEVVDEGNSRLFQIEREMSNRSSEIARLKAEVEAKESNLKVSGQQKERILTRINDLDEKINQKTKELEIIRENKKDLEKIFNEKKDLLNFLLSELEKIKTRNDESLKDLNEKKLKHDSLLRILETKDRLIKEKLDSLNFLANLLLSLEEKNKNYRKLVESLRNKLYELIENRENERRKIELSRKKMHELKKLRSSKIKNLDYALKTIKKARNSLIKFKAQKDLIEKLNTEDSALRMLEEVGKKGLLLGIFGSLEKLIKFDKQFLKAIEAVSKGWLKSLIVKDVDTAIACLKILRESKVGRIKIIPLENFKASVALESKNLKGLIGPIRDLIECDEKFKKIVDKIFGNAYLTTDEEIFKKIKDQNIKIVTLSGDLYEPEGMIEGGVLKETLDLSLIVPSTDYISELEESVKSLEKLIKKEKIELKSIENKVKTLKDEEISCRSRLLQIDEEIEKTNYEYIEYKKLSNLLYKKLKTAYKALKNEKLSLFSLFIEKIKIDEKVNELKRECERLKKEIDPSVLKGKERETSALMEEINSINFKKSELESKLSNLESSIALILESVDELKLQHGSIENREGEIMNSIKELRSRMDLMENEVNRLEIER
ncbi:MAG: chromosome segregation SMC family protein, partial [Candidatus Bathyarchaeia archaeon]